MTDSVVLSFALPLIAGMFALLIGLLGWLGNKMYEKMCSISESMHRIEGDLHNKISNLDKRVTAVETRCIYEHNK